jgi:uncharacterized protein YaiE (UPF0345 family)
MGWIKHMKKLTTLLIFLSSCLFMLPPVYGSVGVGVGTGKIVLDELLKPGLSYELPPITVYNTGDEGSDYYLSIEFSTKEEKLESRKDWYIFTPNEFYLNPGESQVVQVELKLPIRDVKPGEYFAYLTAQPVSGISEGSASVGVAAATKLYFSVISANIFQAIYFVVLDFIAKYRPWSIIVPVFVFLLVGWKILSKKFKIQVTKQ